MIENGLTAHTLSLDGVTSDSGTTDEEGERNESPLRPIYEIHPQSGYREIKCLPSIFKLRDVRKFERENYELLGMEDKDIWFLRLADSVKSWIRFRQDLLNSCIKERLYSRCSIQTTDPLWKSYSGGPKGKSANLMKALGDVGALNERANRRGGTTGHQFACPWKNTCANYDCDHMETSRKRSLMPQS
jgi:hypothetical protein